MAEERVRALEATRDDLANELVAASRVIDEVGPGAYTRPLLSST